ncbi:WD40 repeat domain-containing protein [Singulisphaera sp. Ch08]|uniref:WD40 repeat domain-containing protein n=1 Tax=Singulisphaera sp. Ch08 TaxID=3120278 RepID=A0AAU7C835_9BACT
MTREMSTAGHKPKPTRRSRLGRGRVLNLSSLLVFSTFVGMASAEPGPHLKASWKEKGAGAVVFSPDGKSLVSSGSEGYQLRDAGTGKARAFLSTYRLEGTVFSPDGRFLFAKVGSDRHKPVSVCDLKVWVVATGEEYATFSHISESSNASTNFFALSRDGKLLAFLDNSERLPMEVKTSKMIVDGQIEFTVAFNQSKGLPRVKLWDVHGWKERATVDGGAPLVFSPDDTRLVTGARDWHDSTAKVWDTATGKPGVEFDTGAPWVKPLSFSPDGKYLAIGTSRKQELYELASGRRWPVPTAEHRDNAPVFSTDGRVLFPGGLPRIDSHLVDARGYSCYDVTNLPPIRLELAAGELIVAPNGRRYAALLGKRFSDDSLTLSLCDLPAMREIGRVDALGLKSAWYSPDGSWLFLLIRRNDVFEIRVLDPTMTLVTATIPLRGHYSSGTCGWNFSPDGKSLALYYRTGSNISRPGEPEPSDRPLNVEIWELPTR